jgi:hypothetical protein
MQMLNRWLARLCYYSAALHHHQDRRITDDIAGITGTIMEVYTLGCRNRRHTREGRCHHRRRQDHNKKCLSDYQRGIFYYLLRYITL